MSDIKLNKKFDIPIGELEERINYSLNGDLNGYNHVVSLRDLRSVNEMLAFTTESFRALIRRIPLRTGGSDLVFPYEDASSIRVYAREPSGLEIGQRFILNRKLLSIMTHLGLGGDVFEGFEINGFSQMMPQRLYGVDQEGNKAIAFYIPPIVEIHGLDAVLVDGIHRCYITGRVGATVTSVHITGVAAPLPFDVIPWAESKTVDEKPTIEERYKNLDRSLFRDLSYVGIDG